MIFRSSDSWISKVGEPARFLTNFSNAQVGRWVQCERNEGASLVPLGRGIGGSCHGGNLAIQRYRLVLGFVLSTAICDSFSVQFEVREVLTINRIGQI